MLWFTNIYAAIVAAVLVFMSQIDYPDTTNRALALSLIFFVLSFSAIGFFIVVALSLGHLNYIMNVLMILNDWGMTRYYKDPKKPVHFKVAHRRFFELTFALFVMLLLLLVYRDKPCFKQYPINVIVSLVIIFGTFLIIDRIFELTWGKEFKKRNEFIALLRESKGGLYQHDWDKLIECQCLSEFEEKIKELKQKEKNEKKQDTEGLEKEVNEDKK